MELTWVALAASLMMGLGAACMFIFAVKRNYFHDLEEAKYQVFWSDVETGNTGKNACATGCAEKETNRDGRSFQGK